MRHADFIAQYDVPVADADAPRPSLEWARRGEGRARALAGQVQRRVRGRRMAYLDSHFPWQRSGFRYADALALHAARPDTVFFSMYEMRDPFPAPVLPLAQFPRLAPSLGITDVYGVFLSFMAGIVGLREDRPAPEVIEGLDLSGVLASEGIRAHAGLYPGGGFTATERGFAEARRLVEAADRVFSWSPAVLDNVPGVAPIAPAIIDTAFYARTPRDFSARPLALLFVADAKPRKGLAVALAAMEELADEPVHLHVVGPHDPATSRLAADRATFHGWLGREQLRTLHARCHVILSPVAAEHPGDPGGDGGITDGFPTAAAAEAASSGLLLVTANPDADHRELRPGVDHLEIPATAPAVAAAIRDVLRDPGAAAAIADSGARRVHERLNVRVGVAQRLDVMGLTPGSEVATAPARFRLVRARPPGADAAVAERRALAAGLAEQQRASLEATTGQIGALGATLEALREDQRRLAAEIAATRSELVELARLALDDESATWRALQAARESDDYEAPFTETDPLVSICIPTYTNHEQLLARAIPSALAQDHANIEVVVVGDSAPAETAAGIERLGDPRVRYENLALRGPYPEDPHRRWMVAGTGPLNRSMALARGAWIAILNDDDALRPQHLSTLLAEARRTRDEVVYGRLEQFAPDGSTEIIGTFPPESHGFGWQLALQHRALRVFEYKLAAAVFDEPGDWNRARRMMRAGVRFRMVDEIVCDYYPSTLWHDR